MFNFLKKGSSISLEAFIGSMRKGERNFFKALNVSESAYEEASFDELMTNQDDVLAGVNKVKKNFRIAFFDLFDSSLVKYHDNGDVKFIFYTTTSDTKKILTIASSLSEAFGHGFFDDTKHVPFTKNDRLLEIAKSKRSDGGMDMLHGWSENDCTFLLQYKTIPHQQFSLMVTIQLPTKYDHSIRRKGTILDVLQFNIQELLNSEAIVIITEEQGGKIKFVDYKFFIETKEMDVFDRVDIRIFDSLRHFDLDVQTHITLFASKPISYKDKLNIAERLIKMYGQDISGKLPIQVYELDILDEGDFWTGRTWRFNELHGLYQPDNANENISYEVRISDYQGDEGFNLHINSYNKLINLFSGSGNP